MIIHIGDEVHSDFGHGPVVALTDEWVIHENQNGDEIAVQYSDVWVPAEKPVDAPRGGKEEAELE